MHPCTTLALREGETAFPQQTTAGSHPHAIIVPPRHNPAILPGSIAHGIDNGADALVLYSKSHTLPLQVSPAQSGASNVERWVGIRNGLGCAGPEFHLRVFRTAS